MHILFLQFLLIIVFDGSIMWGNNIIGQMQGDKQKFTKNYIECIVKNHSNMTPTKSCDLGAASQRKTKPNDHLHNYKSSITPKYQFMSIGKINKIFEPIWKADKGKVDPDLSKNQQLIDIFLRKNEEIAASLIKEKKSMSDLMYSVGKQSKYTRYSEQPLTKLFPHDSKIRISQQKPPIFPKINSKPLAISVKKSIESIDYQDTEVVMVTDQRLSNANMLSIQTQQLEKPEEEPSYSDVTNVNIKRFLKLKQHNYEIEDKNSLEQFILNKKKKVQTHKKRMAKKQKQEMRNSLQAYLETRMVHFEKNQGVRASCGGEQKIVRKEIEEEERDVELSKSNINEVEKANILNKINNRSLPKSLKKIGANTKISKKNLFNNQGDAQITIYEQKIKSYRQFIFLIKMTHNIFDPVIIGDQGIKNENKYKYYVGKGNNRQLVKALMKRRFWWIETEDINEACFVWTQLKVNGFFQKQGQCQRVAGQFYENQVEGVEKNAKKVAKIKKNSNLYRPTLPDNPLLKIMTANQLKQYENYLKQIQNSNVNPQRYQNYQNRRKFLPHLKPADPEAKVHNHFENNFYIGNKKALYYNLKKYCQLTNKNLFNIVPLTFHIGEQGMNSEAYKQFVKHFKQLKAKKDGKNIWIVKPGQNSNRGNGISVFDQLYQINKIINSSASKNSEKDKTPHTFIIQKYIEKPLLYKNRKFDIRHYMLATRMHGRMRLYFYGQGYVRTSSSDFDLTEIGDNEIHLTNDAIQKYAENYGKYEEGNKISYTELQRYIDVMYPNRKYSMAGEFYPKIKEIALETFKACYLTMDPQNLSHNFEVFGLDFMIDQNFQVWLIEVNTNPCLQLSSNLLSRIIPTMLQHSLRLSLDPLFPPPCHYANSIKHLVPDNALERLQYELIFDEARDGRDVEVLYRDEKGIEGLGVVEEDGDTYDNDGKELDIDIQ